VTSICLGSASSWWAEEFLSDKHTEALEEKERAVRRIEARMAADEEQERRIRLTDIEVRTG
jgi:hypothetical protein